MLFLDTKRPLSEPGWCKSGDVEEWLAREFGPSSVPVPWKNKIKVIDPDKVSNTRHPLMGRMVDQIFQPPSLKEIMSSWCARASVGTSESRNRFREEKLGDFSRILELLFRVIRGERTYSGNRLESGFAENPTLPASLQTPTILAVSSIVDIAVNFANQVSGPLGLNLVQGQISEVIEKIPSVQLHRALDSMYREHQR